MKINTCLFIFMCLINYCFAKDSQEKILLNFKPDCFIDKNFIQLQGLATISDHKNFIYLQIKMLPKKKNLKQQKNYLKALMDWKQLVHFQQDIYF